MYFFLCFLMLTSGVIKRLHCTAQRSGRYDFYGTTRKVELKVDAYSDGHLYSQVTDSVVLLDDYACLLYTSDAADDPRVV